MAYTIYLTLFGAAALSINWVKTLCEKISISYSIIYFLIGIISYLTIPELPWTHPFRDQNFTKHLTELMVIVALMGVGLKIDRPFFTKKWVIPFLLATVAMILSIGVISGISYYFFGFTIASAVLIGAVLAPTDPVLASDVQVDGPNNTNGHEVKFSLTGEAGLNDGLAFPFTWLAIALAVHANDGDSWLLNWVA